MRPVLLAADVVMYTAMYMMKTRAQLHLTEEQRRRLDDIGSRKGR